MTEQPKCCLCGIINQERIAYPLNANRALFARHCGTWHLLGTGAPVRIGRLHFSDKWKPAHVVWYTDGDGQRRPYCDWCAKNKRVTPISNQKKLF